MMQKLINEQSVLYQKYDLKDKSHLSGERQATNEGELSPQQQKSMKVLLANQNSKAALRKHQVVTLTNDATIINRSRVTNSKSTLVSKNLYEPTL